MPLDIDRLAQQRMARELSPAALATKAAIEPERYERIEAGREQPTKYDLARLSAHLKVTVDYLLGLVDRPTQVREESDLRPDEVRFLQEVRKGKVPGWKRHKKPKPKG